VGEKIVREREMEEKWGEREREGICRERKRKLWIQDWFSVYGSK